MSIVEVVTVTPVAGKAAEYAEAIRIGLGYIAAADGCESAAVLAPTDTETDYLMMLTWTSLAAHDAFVGTDLFAAYRATISRLVAAASPKYYEHLAGVKAFTL